MLLRRKRMLIRCHASGTDQETQREISPMAYQCRDDGYVDAWCHLRENLHPFSSASQACAE